MGVTLTPPSPVGAVVVENRLGANLGVAPRAIGIVAAGPLFPGRRPSEIRRVESCVCCPSVHLELLAHKNNELVYC